MPKENDSRPPFEGQKTTESGAGVGQHVDKMGEEELINELSRVFWDEDRATTVTVRAGFPRQGLPVFRSSETFWTRIVEDIHNGVIEGGLRSLLDAAAVQYPQNRTFTRHLKRVTESSGSSPLPSTNDVASRLDAAFSRREEIAISGESTHEIDEEILELRREQRVGPTLKARESLGNGRFRLVEIVGRGGSATVWKAYCRTTRDIVAIKVLHSQFAEDASSRERLFRGARQMAKLQHPNTVRVILPRGEDSGFYYYVMEYVHGGNLFQAITENRICTDDALEVIERIGVVLEKAHTLGMVHRDIKPQNILLRDSGDPALSDFDLVRAQETTGGTRTGALGTVVYAAPEQIIDAGRVDERADIYSLAMTTLFCLYGKRLPPAALYQREAFLATLACAASLRVVLQKALALDPEHRFKSTAEFLAAFASARQQEHVQSPVRSKLATSPKTIESRVRSISQPGPTYALLSYSWKDRVLVREIRAASSGLLALAKPGADGSIVFQDYSRETEDLSTTSQVVVIFWCNHAATTTRIRQDFETASSKGIALMSIRMDKTPLPPLLKMGDSYDSEVLHRYHEQRARELLLWTACVLSLVTPILVRYLGS